ncbi:MAG: hypothetical protein AMJ81_13705, partial [Phycisphaerae bacterium SM23_33]
RVVIVCGFTILAVTATGPAWHGPGHARATPLACAALPKDLPAFFLAGVETIAHCSQDPDLFRLPAQPELRDGEVPEHFMDLELLEGADLPPTRYAFVQLCAGKNLKPQEVGFVPYAVVEWTQRLTLAFAEHRKWPGNKHVRAKCLVYAGLLAHYAQDLCQPLHTTIHYDGRAKPDGTSPRSGIHTRVDALLQKTPVNRDKFIKDTRPVVFDRLLPAVAAELKRSHALVDRVYELEKQLPELQQPLPPGSAVEGFALERLQAAAGFTASLYLTAWRASAKLELPDWHQRKPR